MTRILWALALVVAVFVALPAQACYYAVGALHPLGGCGPVPPPHEWFSDTFDLGTVYTGQNPDGTGPWLTATFTSYWHTTTGTLTLTSHLDGTDSVQGQEHPQAIDGWAFYVNQNISSIVFVSGTQASTALWSLHGTGIGTGPVPGLFDLAFGWSSGNPFVAGDTAVYTLNFANWLSADPFLPTNLAGWHSAAFVQGIGGSSCSAWIVAGDGAGADGGVPCIGATPPQAGVPEPNELAMFGFGTLLLGGFAGLRRRRA